MVNGETQITYFNSGLEDLSLNKLFFTNEISTTNNGKTVSLSFDQKGVTSFSWSGRVWKKISINLNSTQPIRVIVNVGGQQYSYDLAEETEKTIQFPTASNSYYSLIQIILLATFLVSIYFFIWTIFLFIQLFQRSIPVNNLYKGKLGKIIPYLTCIIFGIISLWIIFIGFQNRLYADDYCYINHLKALGYIKAIPYFIVNYNGRLSSHLLDLLAFEFPKINTVIGPITAVLFIGGSVFYFFFELFLQYSRKQRTIYSLMFALLITGTVMILVPSLYESFIWNLHSIIVSGGFGLFVFACTILLAKSREQQTSPTSFWFGITFLFLGFFNGGFSEVTTVLNLVLFGLILLYIIIRKNENKAVLVYVISFILGNILGMFVIINAPRSAGNMQSLFSGKLDVLFGYFIKMVHESIQEIFEGRSILVISAILVLISGSFLCGISLTERLQGIKKEFTFLEKTFLIFSPFILYLIALFPLSFFRGYFPPRTLAIPLVFSLFIASINFIVLGNSFGRLRILSKWHFLIIISIQVLFFAAVLPYLIQYTGKMARHKSEWNARNAQILLASGQKISEIEITPYQVPMGTDLSTTDNLWLTQCESDFYGINIVVNDKK
jgi:hypothetical protein